MKCPFVIKVCSKCKKLLVANKMNFSKAKKGKWSLSANCKHCQKQYNENNKERIKERAKQYYQDNKEEILEYQKQYYENNRDEIKERVKQYSENNRDEIKEYKKKYREEHKEEIKEKDKKYREEHKDEIKEYKKKYREEHKEEKRKRDKKYYEDNKDEILEKRKQYYKNNPHKIFNACSKRRQREENQGNGITKEQWFEMMNFFEWRCAYSGEYIGGNSEYRTVDHIMPLVQGGLNEIWNCVPMYSNYNFSKHTSDMLEWYQQQEFYSEERLNKIYEWIKYARNKWGNDEAM